MTQRFSQASAVAQGVTGDGVTLDVPRQPTIFKSASGQGGTIAVWTPASGKRFRLLKYWLEIPIGAYLGSAGAFTIQLEDSGVAIGLLHSIYLPGAAPTPAVGGMAYGPYEFDLGGLGYLSSAANNVLQLVCASTITGGPFRIRAAGTEE